MLANYNKKIEEVLTHIKEITKSGDKELDDIIYDYFSNGGKRLRVLLCFIFSRLGDDKKDIIHIASIIEIIHTTSLIHDDIIDKSETRRGGVTLNKKYGDRTALFIGDYLFSVVLREISKIKNKELHEYLAHTLKELCIGEIIQEEGLYNSNTTFEMYLKKIERKTAILIAFSCVSGAICSSATESEIKKAYEFGYNFGISYQIIDDVLDYYGENKKVLGKELAQDLLNGNITLPAIIKFAEDKSLKEKFLKTTLKEDKLKLFNAIREDEKIKKACLKISDDYLTLAKNSLDGIDKEVKEELIFILNTLKLRKY